MMKKKRLSIEEQDRIENKYHDHPLLQACTVAFRSYQEKMTMLLFSPVEVFVEAIDFIDEILTHEEYGIADAKMRWQSLVIKYKQSLLGCPDEEIQNAVSAVFYTVYVFFASIKDDYPEDYSRDALREALESHDSCVIRNEDRVIVDLAQYADYYREWMIHYMDADELLSESITQVANGDDEQDNEDEEDHKGEEDNGGEESLTIFDFKLREDVIINTIRGIKRNDLGQINFAYALHSFFESIGWLAITMDTKFVAWMKQNKLFSLKATNLVQATPNDERMKKQIENLHEVFQEKYPETGEWRDKKEFYHKDKIIINTGEAKTI